MKIFFTLLLTAAVFFTAQSQVKHVILIGSDGLGSYAFEKAEIPNLRKLMSEGAYSLKARAVLPSSSAVNWMSMISGSPPELHGYTEWGSKTPEIPSSETGPAGIYPTLFSLLESQRPDDKKGAAYVWGGISHIIEKEFLDMDFNGSREQVLEESINFITNEKPVFTFIHFSEPDGAGHSIGHDTQEYYEAVSKVDNAIGKIIAALEASDMASQTLVIISSDHGGVEKGHGGKSLAEIEIPWIIWGAELKHRGKINDIIITYDTGATIAYLLGLEVPGSWRGKAHALLFK